MLQSVNEFLENIDFLLSHIEFENDRNSFFQSGLNKYVGSSKIEEDFREFVKTKIRPSLINSKSFTYKNAIISLYGHLENYLEEIAKEYISVISDNCDHFSKLPTRIKKHHLNASMDLLAKIQRTKGSGLEYREREIKEVVKNMYDCLHENSNFLVNLDAFSLHTANFRYDSIHTLFQKIGIDGISRKCFEVVDFSKDLALKHSIDTEVNRKILVSLLISELDDLAQRRNEIAHGVKINNIESLDLLRLRIKLIQSYGKAIHEVVSESLDLFLYSINKKISLGKPARIFPARNVFGFAPYSNQENDDQDKICIGDLVYAENKNSKKRIISGKIISIRSGDLSYESLSLPSGDPYTIGVDFTVTSHMDNRYIFISKAVTK